MNEDMEVLKYIYTNLKIQQDSLYKIIKKKEVKDEVYSLIQDNIISYRRFTIATKKMIQNRMKKDKSMANILLDIASSIGSRVDFKNGNIDYLTMIKESSKINLMDLEKIKKEYKIKSKTIKNLIIRLQNFEENNLSKVAKLIRDNN